MLRPWAVSLCAVVASIVAMPLPAMARNWTDDSGAYQVDAELVRIEDGRAVLRRAGGKGEVRFPLERLSQADRDFLDKSGALSTDTSDPTLPRGVDAKTVQAAEASVNDSIKDDVAAAKTPAKREKLAHRLVEMAADFNADKASRFILLRKAAETAAAVGQAQLVCDSMADLETMVRDSSRAWVVVLAALDTHRPIQDSPLLAGKVTSLIGRAVANDDYDTAIKFCNTLQAIGKQDKDIGLQTAARAMLTETTLAKEEWKRTAPDREKLKDDSGDEKAIRAVGRFLALYKGDFEHGLPLLAASGDKALASVAAADLKRQKSPEEMLAVGDSWLNLAKSIPAHIAAQERAAYWFKQARARADFASRPRIDSRLEPLIQRDWIDLASRVEFPRDQIAKGYWTRDGRRLASAAPAGTWALMVFPDKPTSPNYELALDVENLSFPRNITLRFPVQQRMCALNLKPEGDGLELIDGKYGFENSTTVKPGLLKKDLRFTVRIVVDILEEQAQIVVYIDRAKYIAWRGNLSSIDSPAPYPQLTGAISLFEQDNMNIVIAGARLLNR